MKIKQISRPLLFLLITTLLLTAACAAPAAPAVEETDDAHHGTGHDHDHGDHDDMARIPNEGGVAVRIVSPADGATFAAGDDVVVEIEVENFELGVDGNHWHVYDNGRSYGMVMGSNRSETLVALEPGTHEIAAYIAIGTHEEYEEGDTITITVAE